MKEYKRSFLSFCIGVGALEFGEFPLKSGRKSPYFLNAGAFNNGVQLARLGRFYASAITDADISFEMLYGPAYKGIPIVSSTSIALADHYDLNAGYAFNRKEEKDHGEGGRTIGAPIEGKVLIVDDVITAGMSVRESMEVIRDSGATPVGAIIAFDRQEKGMDTDKSAARQVEGTYGIPVHSIATLADLIEYVREGTPELTHYLGAILGYKKKYGV